MAGVPVNATSRSFGTITNVPVDTPREILRSQSLLTRISGQASIAPGTATFMEGTGLIKDATSGQYRPVNPATEVAEFIAMNRVYTSATEQQVCDVALTGIFKKSELNRLYTDAQLAIIFPNAKIHANVDAVILLG